MKVNREEFLRELDCVAPGSAKNEQVDQSSCFIFREGKVATFNDEIACSYPSSLKFEGAVRAGPLMAILRKMEKDTEVEVEPNGKELIVKGRRSQTGITMEKEITSPYEMVDKPKKWKSLPENFSDAIRLVHSCAKMKDEQFLLTCVHIHPKGVDALDNVQAARYRTKIPIESPTLVRKESIKYVSELGMTEFSETDKWLHFRNPAGLIFSCRRWLEDFQSITDDLTQLFKKSGSPISLPKDFSEAVEKAQIFAKEDADVNKVTVSLMANKIRVRGQGVSGWFKEFAGVKYKGKPFAFRIAPELLIEIITKHNEIEVGDHILIVNGGRFKYVTSLAKVKDEE